MRPVMTKTRLGCGIALALLATATDVAAQTAPNPPDAAAPPATEPKDRGEKLEAIVVTASKRAEEEQNVAGQITALTGAALSEAHAMRFEDFAPFVPGLSYQSSGPTSDLIAIRGITTGGSQLSGAVGMYIDEVPVGASSSFGLAFQTTAINTYDLARVEVLNGPQGTVYGSNALGGTIKYVTAAPELNLLSLQGEVEGSNTAHGDFNDGVRVAANVPLLDHRAALRVDGFQQFDSGWATDPFHQRDGQGKSRTLGGRMSYLMQLSPDVDLRLSAFSQEIHGSGYAVSLRDPISGTPVYGPYDQRYAVAQPSDASLRLYSAVLNWHLPFATLTSVTAYQVNAGQYTNDVSDVYNPLLSSIFGTQAYGLYVNTHTRKYTQEIRLASENNQSFEWLVGGFFAHERTFEFVHLLNAGDPSGNLAGFSPFHGELPSRYREYAAFADGTYYFSPRFDLTLGVRYSQNSQRYQQYAYGLFVVPTNPAETTHEDASSSQNVTTYQITPRFHLNDDVMIYAKAASGYRPGGPNFVLELGKGSPSFDADTLWNYEIGEKARLLDGRATLNVDVYDIEWSKIQLTVNNGGINQLINGGDARIRGAEMEFGYRATSALTFGGSAAYTDAKLTTPVPALGLAGSGARLPLSPRFNFALSGKYRFELPNGRHGEFRVSDHYIGNRTSGYADSPVAPLYKLPGYNTTDLDLSLEFGEHWELDAYAHNVFDTRGQVSASTLANEYNPAAPVPVALSRPRTIGLVLKASFDR